MSHGESAQSFTAELTAIADRLRRATVKVQGRRSGLGSGVIWSQDGVIITNAHVVSGPTAQVELWNGQVLEAKVTACNLQRDLTALQIALPSETGSLAAAPLGDSGSLRVGELVLALGNPLGLTGALSTGIIHALGTTQQPHWIQTDVQLAPGNSGGPLSNAQGAVIGINTLIVEGRGFAVPSHVVKSFLQMAGDRPYLGVTLQPVRIPLQGRRRFGLLVTAVEPDSPAAIAQLQPGDMLLGVRGTYFQTPEELFHILDNSNPGDGLSLEIRRDRQPLTLNIVLWSRDWAAKAA